MKNKRIITTLIALTSLLWVALSQAYIFNSAPDKHPGWFIAFGGASYDLNSPSYMPPITGPHTPGTPITTASSTPKLNLSSSHSEKIPQMAIGDVINNPIQGLKPLFGDKTSIELTGYHYNTLENSFIADAGMASEWLIDGSGQIDEGASRIHVTDLTYNGKTNLTHLELVMQGRKQLTAYLFHTPLVGLIYYNLSQKYNTRYVEPQASNVSQINEAVDTNTVGIEVGDRAEITLAPTFFVFVGATAALLHYHSNFQGNSTFSLSNGEVFTAVAVANGVDDLSYQNTLSLGFEKLFGAHYFNHPVSFTFTLGLLNSGYVPTVVNPVGNDTRPAHIEGRTVNSYFALLNLKIPLGT